jgi:hypothetical protein
VAVGEVVLDGDGGGPDQRQRLRKGDLGSAGEVDRSDERPGSRVVDGHRGAAPGLNDAGEVFGTSDLQLGVERERRAGRIGSGAALTPVGAGHEVHRFGLAARLAIAFDPQKRAVGRGHGHDDAGVGGVVNQQAADDGKRGCKRMRGADAIQGNSRGWQCATEVGVDAGGKAAPPAVCDDTTQRGRVQINLPGDEELMNGAQRRGRQPGRRPAASSLRHSHQRSRSPRAAQFVQVDVRGRNNSPISPGLDRDFGPLRAEFCMRAAISGISG